MKYIKRRFSLVESQKCSLLIAPRLHMSISNEQMLRFLNQNLGETAGYLDKEEVEHKLSDIGLDPEKALSFLVKVGILDPSGDDTGPFEHMVIVTDDEEAIEPLKKSLEDDGARITAILSSEGSFDGLNVENCLVAIMLFDYKPSVVRTLYAKLAKQSGVGFIQGYFYQSTFRVDGLYMPQMGSPCHFCHYDRMIHRDRHSFADGEYSWQGVIDMLDIEETGVVTSISLSPTDIHYAMHVFRRRLSLLIGIPMTRVHLDSWLNADIADLINCRVRSEPVAHWYGCDCLKWRHS